MGDTIKARKGLKANIDHLLLGEFGFTTDEERVYIGGNNGNIPLPNVADLSEKAQNIAQLSNPNLLINGDFQVWQRGTSFTSTFQTYTSDRWYSLSSNNQFKVEKVTNGMKITALADNSTIFLFQKLEDTLLSYLNGKKVTKSISIDGAITTLTFSHDGTNGQYVYTGTFNTGQSIIINWVKLELGDKATPFVPRPYAEELALCQRYYQRNFINTTANTAIATTGTMFIKTHSIMRVVPTVSVISGADTTTSIKTVLGTSITPTNLRCLEAYETGFIIAFDNATVGNQYVLGKDVIQADAEIY